MKRFAMTVLLKDDPEVIRRYDEYHANPWPEVRMGLVRCGVRRLFIYRRRRHLFLFMETAGNFSLERDMPKYMDDPKVREWDEIMQNLQEPVEGAPRGSTWIEMKEVFSQEG